MIWTGAVVIAGVLLVALLGRRLLRTVRLPGPRQAMPRADINADGSGRFHALSIRFGAGACAAARALHGKRFLSPQAPALPLATCDSQHCRCRFVHHRDRRDGEDRRSPFQSGYGGSATRIERDRRRADDRRSGGRDGEQYQ